MPETGSQIHDCSSEHYELKTDAKNFQCYGCKVNGFGERYTFNLSGRELHKECRDREPEVSDENFGGSVFKFYDKPFTKKNGKVSKCCDACGKDIRGFNYHCCKMNLDLHPCCVKLEKKQELLHSKLPSPAQSSTLVNVPNRRVVTATSNKMSITGSGIGDCQHCHELKTDAKKFQCYGCKLNGFGERHTCNLCGRELHKECKDPDPKVVLENFGGSVFKFYDKPFTKKNGKKVSKCCVACGKYICGFNYNCDKLDLHPRCARLEKKKVIDREIFDLQTKVSSKCGKCEKKKISREVQGWSYVSQCKTYHLHVYCMYEMLEDAYLKHGDKALENIDLRELVTYNRNRKGGDFFTFKMLVKVFLSVILCDPLSLVYNVAVELISSALQ